MNRTLTRHNAAALLGRILLALIFVVSGLSKIPAWQETVQYMISAGLPVPGVLLFPAIFVEVISGVMLLIGYRARLAAGLLSAYLVVITVVFHHFWSLQGMDRQIQLGNFMKNVAIMGGLLQILANGAGSISLDQRFNRDRVPFEGEKRRLRLAQ